MLNIPLFNIIYRVLYIPGVSHVVSIHDRRHRGTSAPKLLWSLLDGLVWRSRQATNGKRRVNFYVPWKFQVWTFGMQIGWHARSRTTT